MTNASLANFLIRLAKPSPNSDARKRRAVDDAIAHFGVPALQQKEREGKLLEHVAERAGLMVSDRFVRERFKIARESWEQGGRSRS
jgi:hypothetical protein